MSQLQPNKTKTEQARFIVVEGPIGVGKTALARKLAAEFGSELLLEDTTGNPFLERFYRSGYSQALPTQLYFLFQRARQVEVLTQDDLFRPTWVADFLMDKDRLFAEVTLDTEELALYDQIYAKLAVTAPAPDLVVYLQAPADVLLRRIARRGVDFEALIDRAYLERLADAYARYFYEYTMSPLLIVNSASIDPINNENDFADLVEQIHLARSGRRFFNPYSSAALG